MPANIIDANGLTIQTRQQIVDELLNGADGFRGYYAIYGPTINVDPNSSDGQLINLIAQAKVDVLELIQQIFDGMDPDQAIGRVLDQRCAINGVVRHAGTYTLTNVDVTATQAVTITGVDDDPDNPFTVSDEDGNKYVLLETYAFVGAGTQTLAFRAKEIGAIDTTVNTITTMVTILLGISGVNNPDTATSTGTNEETDYALRIRRSKSVAVPSKGYLEGLIGALLAIDDVTNAIVLENDTNTTDGDGIPGHSIWVIVNGGTNTDVAQAIYVKRNAGCGMKGSVEVVVTQVNNSTFTIKFDRPTPENLWISFDLTAITGSIDAAYVRAQILANLSYDINQPADASAIVAMVKAIAPNAYVSEEGVSDADASYVAFKETTAVNNQWAIAAARIKINGTPG